MEENIKIEDKKPREESEYHKEMQRRLAEYENKQVQRIMDTIGKVPREEISKIPEAVEAEVSQEELNDLCDEGIRVSDESLKRLQKESDESLEQTKNIISELVRKLEELKKELSEELRNKNRSIESFERIEHLLKSINEFRGAIAYHKGILLQFRS